MVTSVGELRWTHDAEGDLASFSRPATFEWLDCRSCKAHRVETTSTTVGHVCVTCHLDGTPLGMGIERYIQFLVC